MVGVWGWLGFGLGVFFPIFFFFFLFLHWNTLQQRNWKSCLKVGHSSAVSIETSSQRAVRFTSTGGAFARRMGYSRLSPLTRVLRSTLQGGTERGDTAQDDQGMVKGNAPVSKAAPREESRDSAHLPCRGKVPPAVGWQLLVPPNSHRPQSSDSPKNWHNFHTEIKGFHTANKAADLLCIIGRLHLSASTKETKC